MTMRRSGSDEGAAAAPGGNKLSRRERQIMDILYKNGPSSVAEVLEALPDPPGYSSVRTLLRVLEEKGHVSHREDGKRYVYRPTRPREGVAGGALRRVVQTFFGGSVEQTVATCFPMPTRACPSRSWIA
jgi:predicted transcriptional regulator